jgi:hypothetical protein
MIYDTLKLSKTLRDKAHFTPEQAEGLAEALNDAAQSDLATKSDIMGLKANIQSVRREIVEAKAELLKWIITALGLQTVVIIVAIIGAIITIVRSVH